MKRFNTHEELFRFLDKMVAEFKEKIKINHLDLSKCDVHISLAVAEFCEIVIPVTSDPKLAAKIAAVNKRVN